MNLQSCPSFSTWRPSKVAGIHQGSLLGRQLWEISKATMIHCLTNTWPWCRVPWVPLATISTWRNLEATKKNDQSTAVHFLFVIKETRGFEVIPGRYPMKTWANPQHPRKCHSTSNSRGACQRLVTWSCQKTFGPHSDRGISWRL